MITKTFRMTRDRFHWLTPLILMPILIAQPIVLHWALRRAPRPPPPAIEWLVLATIGSVWLILIVTTMLAPRAVVVTARELVIERFAWPAFRVPLTEVTAVGDGPPASFFRSKVRRVAGNGGWIWSGGLFSADGIGRVRAWLTRLGPTVVVRRKAGLPMLLTVDDAAGFTAAVVSAQRARP